MSVTRGLSSMRFVNQFSTCIKEHGTHGEKPFISVIVCIQRLYISNTIFTSSWNLKNPCINICYLHYVCTVVQRFTAGVPFISLWSQYCLIKCDWIYHIISDKAFNSIQEYITPLELAQYTPKIAGKLNSQTKHLIWWYINIKPFDELAHDSVWPRKVILPYYIMYKLGC